MRYLAAVLLVLVVGACGGEDEIPSRLSIVVQGSIKCDGDNSGTFTYAINDADGAAPTITPTPFYMESCEAAIDAGDHWMIACVDITAPSLDHREIRIDKALDGGEHELWLPSFDCGSVVTPIVSIDVLE